MERRVHTCVLLKSRRGVVFVLDKVDEWKQEHVLDKLRLLFPVVDNKKSDLLAY